MYLWECVCPPPPKKKKSLCFNLPFVLLREILMKFKYNLPLMSCILNSYSTSLCLWISFFIDQLNVKLEVLSLLLCSCILDSHMYSFSPRLVGVLLGVQPGWVGWVVCQTMFQSILNIHWPNPTQCNQQPHLITPDHTWLWNFMFGFSGSVGIVGYIEFGPGWDRHPWS